MNKLLASDGADDLSEVDRFITSVEFGLEMRSNSRFRITPYSRFLISCLAREGFVKRHICDFGCGTGIISLDVASKHGSQVIGLDIAEEAIMLSKQNQKQNKIENCRFLLKDDYLEERLIDDTLQGFDVVISNPASLPVPENGEIGSFADGGSDGDLMIRDLILFCSGNLVRGGELLFLHTSLAPLEKTLEYLDSLRYTVAIEYLMQLEFRSRYDAITPHITQLKNDGKNFFFENDSKKYELVYFIRATKTT